MQNKKSLTWIWILLLLAALSAFAWFVVIPWWNKDKDQGSPDTGGVKTPKNGSGGGNGSGGDSETANSSGNTSNKSVLPLYQSNKNVIVAKLPKKSPQAKLAQYITKEGLKASGLGDTVGSVDGIVGTNTKNGIKALIGTLPYPMRIFTAEDITLEALARLVNAIVSGPNEPVETGIARITYNMLK